MEELKTRSIAMPFKPISNKAAFPKMEEDILQFWRDKDVFQRSMKEREGGPPFAFYEGPPTANGQPGIHHVLARVFKDIFPRYKTMRGYYVRRKAGWDTHGLPVELEIERELGLSTKRDIEAYGIEKFNQMCRESVFRYVQDWEKLTERIAYWVDLDNAYVTYTNDYVESLWWMFKQLWDNGLIYQGYKVTPHCPRCDTSLSSHEVALGYRDDTPDPSVYIRFRIKDTEKARTALSSLDVPTSFLVWTTTPWTLPANTGLAVSESATYAVVEGDFGQGMERLVLAEPLLGVLRYEHQVAGWVQGAGLVGLTYEPLYVPEPTQGGHRVVPGDFVSMEDGTGIVHIAPAYGADDLEVSRKEGLPVLHTVHLNGTIMDTVPQFAGQFIKTADPGIIRDLRQRGLLYRSETIQHTYPFCWRCGTPLVYYAKNSWYIQTTAVKDRMVSGNQEVNWYPEHIKNGRFGEWLANNIDWAVSRSRFWGTPMPVWTCKSCGNRECVGSIQDLRTKANVQGVTANLDLHRPYVDNVTWQCAKCGGRMEREPDVLDAWYDSGGMPVAQWHYPFENKDVFAEQFPADYICEAVDQTRGWFYTLHALSTLLFNGPSYKNVICLGHVLDEQGEKMSKSKGNVVQPWPVLDQHGADAVRWYMYTASAPGNPRRFSANLVGDAVRRFMLPLWNVTSFFVTYANIDKFDPASATKPAEYTGLDRWILSELNILVRDVTGLLEAYDPTDATRRIQDFVDGLSNWYVRRSRRRFWKSGSDADKLAAYHTLYTVLTTLSKLLAPFAPFVAEEMHQALVTSVDRSAPDSVHLAAWPEVDLAAIDEQATADTRLAIRLSSLGRAARSKANVRVRQPLARALVVVRGSGEREAVVRIAEQVRDELNVRDVVPLEDAAAFVTYTVRPDLKVLGPKYGQRARDIARALGVQDPAQVAAAVAAGKTVSVDGFILEPSEVLVDAKDRAGFVSAQEGGVTVAVDVSLTPDLQREGLAREIVHRIQTMRKDAGFDIEDRIVTYWRAEGDVPQVMSAHADYIRQETLADNVVAGEAPSGAITQSFTLDGVPVTLGVSKSA